jgi:acyl-coenzyme A synthetase/AMP-(fatty) acid ligase
MLGVEGEAPLGEGAWVRTGDVGRADGEGRIAIVGRSADLVCTGGVKVAPARVEAVLEEHPDVLEACVVGVPDEEWGERVVAVVRPSEGARAGPSLEASLAALARARLSPAERPREWRFAAGPLPRTEGGKVRRAVMRHPAPPVPPNATA